MNKRIFALAMSVLMILTCVFSFASCMGSTDNGGNNNGGGTAVVTPHSGAHKDNNCDGKCDLKNSDGKVCGKAATITHTYEDGECTKCGAADPDAEHVCIDNSNPADGLCDICGETINTSGSHTCDDVNGDGKCEECGKPATHTCVDANDDGTCDKCGEDMPIPQCEAGKCVDRNSNNECDVCGYPVDCDHADANSDTLCDYCQAYVAPKEEDIDYPWDSATIIMQLTENTAGQEILSVSKKYLAGDPDAGSDMVSDEVRARNAQALAKTGIRVTYLYYPDTKEYGWGTSIERIQQTNLKGGDQAPDIYCNFVYDMVGASVKQCFANLLANNISSTRKDNYFEFIKPTYDASINDRGFMYEYMESLTLAPGKKMYVLSSDYFIDMVRAFFCVPVSVKVLESSGASVVAQNLEGEVVYEGGDRNGDGEFTLDDFYQMVKDGEWTYTTLARFSEAVYKPASTNDGACNIGDDVVGFAMSSGGLSSSGLLYTTSVEIIKKEKLNDGSYDYNYPAENEDFYAFCDATTKLFGQTKGVTFVNSGYSEFGDSSLLAIRARFTDHKVLFGDIVVVGALEFNEYQDMKENGGFGVVPVPLYRDGSNDQYLTQVHNIGSCGAISIVTNKFSECTAFLNYQSTHSEEILNNYYEYKLQYDLAGGSTGTIDMLQYIRENVRSSFDKAMEDAIAVFLPGAQRWHNVLAGKAFQVDIRADYKSTYGQKESQLDALARDFPNFAD